MDDPALTLLHRAAGQGGGLEANDIDQTEMDILAECIVRGLMQRHEDEALQPSVWFTITEAGQALVE